MMAFQFTEGSTVDHRGQTSKCVLCKVGFICHQVFYQSENNVNQMPCLTKARKVFFDSSLLLLLLLLAFWFYFLF